MGTGESIALALELLAPAGTVAVLGTTDRIVLDLDNPYGLLIQPEATIVGSLGKTPRDFAEAVHLVASGILPPGLTAVAAWPWRELEGAWAAPPTSRQAIVWDQG
jgi:threonine dehydrogenase-like Zn-dependent dehydrogenase